MGRALRYRLFGVGKMPEVLRRAAEQPGVLLAQEGISIRESVSELRIPRAGVRQGTRLMVGSLVIAPGPPPRRGWRAPDPRQ